MRGHLLLTNCRQDELTRPSIELALKEDRLLWLDLEGADDEVLILEAYMSMVSNRLNDVMKQLTIIATVFLPLSFLTGFFGQNLGFLVNHIGSLTAFLVFGIGTEALAVIALFALFRRRGWLGKGR